MIRQITAPSFRAAIALWTLVLSGSVLIAVTLTAYLMVSQQKMELLDTQVKAFANRLPSNPAGRTGMQRLEQTREWFLDEADAHISIRNQDGQTLFRSENWPDTIAIPSEVELLAQDTVPSMRVEGAYPRGPYGGQGRHLTEPGVWRFETLPGGAARWRFGVFSTADSEYRILVSLAGLDNGLASLRWRLFGTLLPAMLFLAGGGWMIAGRAIRPLDNIAKAAASIVEGQLSERIEPAERAPEIDRIIALLNQMLDRLETNYQQALRFSADASHELKTPLTLMQNTLMSQLNSVPAEGREAFFCSEMLEHLSRLKRPTGGLLLLARADSGQLPQAVETFDAAELCRELCADVQSLAELESDSVVWETEIPETLPVTLDRSFVRTVIFNLLINALHYSARPAFIQVSLTAKDATVRLQVTNNGQAIAPEDTERIFDRFYRGLNQAEIGTGRLSGDSGTGLGLAIARELARVLGGDVVLSHSGADFTRFEFSFPARATPSGKMNKN